MKSLPFLFFFMAASIGVCQHFEWVERVGGNGAGNDYGHDIHEDDAGNIYVAGLVKNNSLAGVGVNEVFLPAYGNHDVFIAKYKHDATLAWAKRYGAADTEYAHRVTMDSANNLYFCGDYKDVLNFDNHNLANYGSNNIFLGQFDTSGNDNWVIGMGSTLGAFVDDMVTDVNGNSYVLAHFKGTFTLGANNYTGVGNSDVLIFKIDNQGNPMWARRFGDAWRDEGLSIELGSDGNLVASGVYTGSINFDGNILGSQGNLDTWLVKLDTSGNVLWSHSFCSTGNVFSRGMALDSMSNVYLSGGFDGELTLDATDTILSSSPFYDMYHIKLDTSGSILWQRVFGDSLCAEQTFCMDTKNDGTSVFGILMPATTVINGDTTHLTGDKDWLILELDPDGQTNWSIHVNGHPYGGKDPSFNRIKYTDCGHILTTGGFLNNVQFFPDSLAAYGTAADLFFAKIIPKMNFDTLQTEYHVCSGTDFTWTYEVPCYIDSLNISLVGNDTLLYTGGLVDIDSVVSNYNMQMVFFDGYFYDTMYVDSFITNQSVVELNILNDTLICEGDSVEISIGSFNSYLWSTGDTSPGIYVSDSGYYSVEAIDSAGCAYTDTSYIAVETCEDIRSIEKEIISLYPNPTLDIINIEVESGTDFVVEIFNNQGSVIMVSEMSKSSINVAHLAPGVYILKIEFIDGRVGYTRFVINS